VSTERMALKESLLASMISPLKKKGYHQPNSRVGFPGIFNKTS